MNNKINDLLFELDTIFRDMYNDLNDKEAREYILGLFEQLINEMEKENE